jgi:hypothetical protein
LHADADARDVKVDDAVENVVLQVRGAEFAYICDKFIVDQQFQVVVESNETWS